MPVVPDPSYSPFTYSWTVDRTISTDSQPLGKRARSSSLASAIDGDPPLLDNGGSNFYENSLNVLVEGAAGTLMAHLSNERHATSISTGAINYGVSIAFSGRLADAWEQVKEQEKKGELITSCDSTIYNI